MSMFICGEAATPEPVARIMLELATCCFDAAEKGPAACTCWVPVYDLDQAELDTTVTDPATRLAMCADCAYRPGSPEQSGDDRYAHSDPDGLDHLDDLVAGDAPFFCHQGMRKPTAWRHPAGITIDVDVDAYGPPIRYVDTLPELSASATRLLAEVDARRTTMRTGRYRQAIAELEGHGLVDVDWDEAAIAKRTAQSIVIRRRPRPQRAIPYKADGTPADICAGWAARHQHTVKVSS